MRYVQLSEGAFQVVCPLGLWPRCSADVKVIFGYCWYISCIFRYICGLFPHYSVVESAAEPIAVHTYMPHQHQCH